MRPEPPQFTYTLSRQNVVVGLEMGHSFWDDGAEHASMRSAQQLGRNIFDFIVGTSTQEWWHRLFRVVRESRGRREIRYRCDAPDLKRFMHVQLSHQNEGAIVLEHYVRKVEPLPVHLRFRLTRSPDSIRCSICNDVRHGGVWRSPEVAWALGFLKTGSINTVTYDICDSCACLLDVAT